MKKIIGFIVILLMIPFIILVISDIDKIPIYPTTEFNIEKITRISSLDLENNIELPKLPNYVGDKWLSDGTIERNVGKVVFNGSENWVRDSGQYSENTALFAISYNNAGISNTVSNLNSTNDAISNFFPQDRYISVNIECFSLYTSGSYLYVRINKSRLFPYDYIEETSSTHIPAFKSWLASNKLEILYQLATPTIENTTTLPEFIDFYDGGSVIVDEGIVDYTVVENQAQINYIEGNITTYEDGFLTISKPAKIISKSNDLYDYDLSTLPNYLEYGSLQQGAYNNILEFINDNQNIKLFYDDIIQEGEYNIYLENDIIIVSNDTEFIRIYEDDTYTSIRNLDTNITYKLEGYDIIDYTEGGFDNAIIRLFWAIPVLLAGLLIYILFKRKE